jgi:hypothetical protein
MSLEQNSKKIKLFQISLFLVPAMLFIALIFQISWLSLRYNFSNNDITIEESQSVKEIDLNKPKGDLKNFYIGASKSGTKYYYQNCTGLKRVKEVNLVFFTSESQAEGAGYALAKNCKKP